MKKSLYTVKRPLLIITGIIGALMLIIIAVNLFLMMSFQHMKCPYGRDINTIDTIGNLCYYEWLDDGTKYFRIESEGFTINTDTLGYRSYAPYVYILENPRGHIKSYDPDTNSNWYELQYWRNGTSQLDPERYTDLSQMPKYAKVNSETGDTWWYRNFEEMSPEDAQRFKELVDVQGKEKSGNSMISPLPSTKF